jgi:hypothetical protein
MDPVREAGWPDSETDGRLAQLSVRYEPIETRWIRLQP